MPYRVTDLYVHDDEMMGTAKRYVVNPGHPPSAYDAELAYARISLMLQAAMWYAPMAFVPVAGREIKEDPHIGKYLMLTTGADSVKALRLLVESGRLDRVKTLVSTSKAREGKSIIASVHGSSADHVAMGFLLEADNAEIGALTDGGDKPLYVFFTADGAGEGKLAGFPLNVKI